MENGKKKKRRGFCSDKESIFRPGPSFSIAFDGVAQTGSRLNKCTLNDAAAVHRRRTQDVLSSI